MFGGDYLSSAGLVASAGSHWAFLMVDSFEVQEGGPGALSRPINRALDSGRLNSTLTSTLNGTRKGTPNSTLSMRSGGLANES